MQIFCFHNREMNDHFADLEGKFLIPKKRKNREKEENLRTGQQTGIEKREGGKQKIPMIYQYCSTQYNGEQSIVNS